MTERGPAQVAVLELEAQPHVARFRDRRQRGGHRVRPADPVYHHGFQPTAVGSLLLLVEEVAGLTRRAEGHVERAQQSHHDVGRGVLALPADVPICRLDTVKARQCGQIGVERTHPSDPRM